MQSISSNDTALNTTDRTLTAITGGIGSGKSVVSRILRVLGYPVYDCDSRAKALMDADELIKQQIIDAIDRETIAADGTIDRRRLASIVFADAEKLTALNAIVHSAVKLDICRWVEKCGSRHSFVETAILFQSGLNETVSDEWRVAAPDEIRISRVMKRNSLLRPEVEARIASQIFVPSPEMRVPPLYEIINDNKHALLPQVQTILKQY